MSLYDELGATASAWAYEAGDKVRCRLVLVAGTSAEIRWVDWMSAQLCGFLCRGGAAPEAVEEARADATALPDERRCVAADRLCFLASAPRVLLAGRQLAAGVVLAFDVWGELPAGLPPSHRGELARIEYSLVVTARMMRPPLRGRSEWTRGANHQLRLPLPVLLGATGGRRPAGAVVVVHPAGWLGQPLEDSVVLACSIDSAEEERPDRQADEKRAGEVRVVGWASERDIDCVDADYVDVHHDLGASFDAEQRLEDDADEEEEAESGGRGAGQGGAAWHEPGGGASVDGLGGGAGGGDGRFLVAVDGSPLASVVLLGTAHSPGDVLRGHVRFDPPGRGLCCDRLVLTLDIQEELRTAAHAGGGGTGIHTCFTAVRSEDIAAGPVVRASFELLLPRHAPPTLDSPALALRWVLHFRFFLAGAHPGDPAARQLDWILPLDVGPADRPASRPPPFAQPPKRTIVLFDPA